ncbi:3-isopropylmalate dehydrogenase [Wallemia mellicola]|uniref:3-isopropylmalate dehydrogenase n=1 Tax=Wallemia mellicola TaxID=1708541 RepID=A0A4T0SIU8_9BASI|nr:3-isopropylmalate dehydrogenase [Wallemia mellicola]TIB96569.1 3-isopropylmalate dehydrogenase [Wallemia mellicola]TIC01070.1 3-isopropylmalate dehydrogenase [Wallemia mellicola]TIC08858.1 3-isopropylmalate dehydrogenase [Wallemia mellicola]TIC13744.1 3-isopropylmalate dehydrogenase [Wallemia mellicola]
MSHNITVLAGDGIGPEVIGQATRVFDKISEVNPSIKFNLTHKLFGGCAIDATGEPLPSDTLESCRNSDAVLMGSVGGPKWGPSSPVRPEQGILALRKALNLFANIRPASFASDSLLAYTPLKEEVAKGTDVIILRELTGGIYFGKRQEADANGYAFDTMEYSQSEVERIARVAAELALSYNPPLPVHSIDKCQANVLATSRLWRKTVTELYAKEYPQIELDHHYVDSASMFLVNNPRRLNGVALMENLFGDILSDEASVIPGALGLLPSSSLSAVPNKEKKTFGLHEPIGGSAPDIAGQGIANPVGTILSAALLLRYSLGLHAEAAAVELAVRKVLDDEKIGGRGLRTGDLGGKTKTAEFGDAFIEELEKALKA